MYRLAQLVAVTQQVFQEIFVTLFFFRSTAAMQPSGRKAALAAGVLSAVHALTPATAAPLAYQSALDGYQTYEDQPTAEWKKVNDLVGAIGGWREYARQATETGAPPAASGNGAKAAAGQTPPALLKSGSDTPEKSKP